MCYIRDMYNDALEWDLIFWYTNDRPADAYTGKMILRSGKWLGGKGGVGAGERGRGGGGGGGRGGRAGGGGSGRGSLEGAGLPAGQVEMCQVVPGVVG